MHLLFLAANLILFGFSGCKKAHERSDSINASIEMPVSDADATPEIRPNIENPAPPSLPPIAPDIGFPGYIGGGGGGGGRENHGEGSGSGHHGRDDHGMDEGYVHFVPNSYAFWISPDAATTHLLEGCTG